MTSSDTDYSFVPIYANVRPVGIEVQIPQLLQKYQAAKNRFWLPRDINLDVDEIEWSSALTEDERHLLSRILSFMAVAHGSIDGNIMGRFYTEIKLLEVKYFHDLQCTVLNFHAENVARILQWMVPDDRQRFDLLNSSIMLGNVSEQRHWAKRWMLRGSRPLAERLAAFVCGQAIFFRSSYAVLEWFKNRGMLPGLTESGERMAGDVLLHAEFAWEVLCLLQERPSVSTMHKLVEEAVNTEIQFIRDAMVHLTIPELEVDDLIEYVMYTGDNVLTSLGYEGISTAENPFAFEALPQSFPSAQDPPEHDDMQP